MAYFIELTQETGTEREAIYVNVDQVAVARFSPERKTLKVTLCNGQELSASGEEAESAIAMIRNHGKSRRIGG